jgi:hypothetical protein
MPSAATLGLASPVDVSDWYSPRLLLCGHVTPAQDRAFRIADNGLATWTDRLRPARIGNIARKNAAL